MKSLDSMPVLATLPPVNPDVFGADARNNWVSRMNDLIEDLAREQGALLVDIEAAFRREPKLSDLFSDHVHPNDRGYGIMAETFFAAITQPASEGEAFEPAWHSGITDTEVPLPEADALPAAPVSPEPRRRPLAR